MSNIEHISIPYKICDAETTGEFMAITDYFNFKLDKMKDRLEKVVKNIETGEHEVIRKRITGKQEIYKPKE